MAYIGKSPSNGVRNRFQYQATAGQQTFSNADANGLTLTYTDSLYMDVYQNGILLVPGDDYTATTGTTVVLVQAASLNDIVEMVVYDVFSVNDSVSASSGGTFSSAVTFGGGVVVANGGNIGSASDTDAMSISSGGVVTFTQNTVGAGGMDLLLDATLTTSLGNIDISSTYINSTYDDYLLLFNLDPDEDDRHLYIQVFVGGSALGGDVYAYEAALLSGNEYENDNDTTVFRLNSHGIGFDAGEGISGQLLFQNVNDTSHSFCYSGFTNFFNTSGNHNGNAVSGSLIPANRASVVNGLRIYFSGGQAVGDFKLYGLRT